MDELPTKEWVAIFYPTTGAARLCPTLDFARNAVTSDSAFLQHVYKSANDLRVRHDHAFLENCWRAVYKNASWMLSKSAIGKVEDYSPEPPDTDTENFSKLLWDFIQDVGDRLTAPKLDNTIKTKENYELKLPLMRDLIDDEVEFKGKYNNQARTVFLALYENGDQFITEDRIKQLILQLVVERRLKTKQKPWTIFQYYRPQFIKDGYVVRGRASKKSRE